MEKENNRLDFTEFEHTYAHDNIDHELLNGFCACGKPENDKDNYLQIKDIFHLTRSEKKKLMKKHVQVPLYVNTLLEEYYNKLPASAGLSLDKNTLIDANLLHDKYNKITDNSGTDIEYVKRLNDTIEEMDGLYKFKDNSIISFFYMDLCDYVANVSDLIRGFQFNDVNKDIPPNIGEIPDSDERPAIDDPDYVISDRSKLNDLINALNEEAIKLKNKWPSCINLMEYSEFKKRVQKRYVNHVIVLKEGFPYSINTKEWASLGTMDYHISVDPPDVVRVFDNKPNKSIDVSYLKTGTATINLRFVRDLDSAKQTIPITVFSLLNSYDLPDFNKMIYDNPIPLYKLTEEDFETLVFDFAKSYGLIHNASVVAETGSILQDYHFNTKVIDYNYIEKRDELFIYKINREEERIPVAKPEGMFFEAAVLADTKIKEYNIALIQKWYEWFGEASKPWFKDNTLYFISSLDPNHEPDATVHKRNIQYILDLYKNTGKKVEPENIEDAYKLEFTNKLYYETNITKPVIHRKNLHQINTHLLKLKDNIDNHNVFKLLDTKDRFKVNPFKIYAQDVFYYDMDRVLPCKLNCDLQSILDWLYVKYSTEEEFVPTVTKDAYTNSINYRADLIEYSNNTGLLESVPSPRNSNYCTLQRAISKLLTLLVQAKPLSYDIDVYDIDTFYRETALGKHIYYKDTYNLGIDNVEDMINYLFEYRFTNAKYPLFKKRLYTVYKELDKPADYDPNKPLYDGSGKQVLYSINGGDTWTLTEDVLPESVDYKDGGWKAVVSAESKEIFLMNNTNKNFIWKSADGLNYTPLQVKSDDLLYLNDISVSKDGKLIIVLDEMGRIYRSNNHGETFELIEDARYDYMLKYEYITALPLDDYNNERDGFGVVITGGDPIRGGRYGIFKDYMEHDTRYVLDKDTRLYPLADNVGNATPVNMFVDIRSTFDQKSEELLAYKDEKLLGVKYKDLMNNPVSLNNYNLEEPKTKFGTDFELRLSLLDTSFDKTTKPIEILPITSDRTNYLKELSNMKENVTKINIQSPKSGFIQLDGFTHLDNLIKNDTIKRPLIITETFKNYNTHSDRINLVFKKPEEFVKEVKEYLRNKYKIYGKKINKMMTELTVEVLFDLPFNDERRNNLTREFYTNTLTKTEGEYNPNTESMNRYGGINRIHDILYLTHIGYYNPDREKCKFVRYIQDAARFKNSLKNAYTTIEEMQNAHDLKYSVLKNIFFKKDEDLKMSSIMKDPFETITENNLLTYPINIKIKIYPTEVIDFKNIDLEINRELSKTSVDGDILVRSK